MDNRWVGMLISLLLMASVVAGGVYVQASVSNWRRGKLAAQSLVVRSCTATLFGTSVPLDFAVLALAGLWLPGVLVVLVCGLLAAGGEDWFLIHWHDPRQWDGRLGRELGRR